MRVGGASESFLEERRSRVGVGEGTGDEEARTGRMPIAASHLPVNIVEDRGQGGETERRVLRNHCLG